MRLNLTQVPFSRRGSYMAISHLPEHYWKTDLHEGLYLRTVHGNAEGSALKRTVCKLTPIQGGKEVPYTYEASPEELVIRCEGGEIRLCFAETDVILMKGTGEDIGLRMSRLSDGLGYNFASEVYYDGRSYYMINAAKNDNRYIVLNQEGGITVDQSWEVQWSWEITIDFTAKNGSFLAVLEEVDVEWVPRRYAFDYDAAVAATAKEIAAYIDSAPPVPEQYAEARTLAAYINWVSVVRSHGFLGRDAMFMSKNIMCSVWSWDHCFNAMALSRYEPELAWDQFMLPFDHQDQTGCIPDYVNDSHILQGFVKPPIHGWALSRMMEVMELTPAQMQDAYIKLSNWTRWWLNYRDGDRDGVCEYWHGNDSGWDNATAFYKLPPVELPDLSAFLVVQMDVLADLAGRLGRARDAADWKRLADETLAAMLRHCFEDGEPIAQRSRTHERVDCDCLILYVPILLGKRLPEDVLRRLVETLHSEKYYTAHGFATESPQSELYQPDGYWRGPIWAPSSMIIIDGLYRAGEKEFADEAARKFCDLVMQSGCAENYDALTGEGLRDRAYTWTASVFFMLAERLLGE
jgi:putative isomerase